METRIIEINGVKVEVDLRTCKNIESYKVGDPVKVLIKDYADKFTSYPGVIVGFDNFEKLPTMIIMYAELSYSSAKLQLVFFNAQSKDVEICPAIPEVLSFEKEKVLKYLNDDIQKKQLELDQAITYRDLFLKQFQQYFKA